MGEWASAPGTNIYSGTRMEPPQESPLWQQLLKPGVGILLCLPTAVAASLAIKIPTAHFWGQQQWSTLNGNSSCHQWQSVALHNEGKWQHLVARVSGATRMWCQHSKGGVQKCSPNVGKAAPGTTLASYGSASSLVFSESYEQQSGN